MDTSELNLIMPDWFNIDIGNVTDLQSAQAAIDEIITEGEGAPDHREDSHYGRCLTIQKAFRELSSADPGFQPVRNVPSDPALTPVSNPRTLEMMRVFDDAYETMLMLLLRYYARVDSSNLDLTAALTPLANAFLPMMSMVMRTLGEQLTLEPLAESGDACAGAPFRIGRNLSILMHERASFVIYHERLVSISERLAKLASGDESGKLTAISENVGRIAMNLDAAARQLEN